MTAARCKQCGKNKYTAAGITHALIATAQTTGKATRSYACPHDPTVFHITTQVKRSHERR